MTRVSITVRSDISSLTPRHMQINQLATGVRSNTEGMQRYPSVHGSSRQMIFARSHHIDIRTLTHSHMLVDRSHIQYINVSTASPSSHKAVHNSKCNVLLSAFLIYPNKLMYGSGHFPHTSGWSPRRPLTVAKSLILRRSSSTSDT